jgi:hypothetical protein
MIKYPAIFLITLLLQNGSFGQSEVKFEQYHVVNTAQPYLFMPVMQYQHRRKWYAEARYNYDDAETFSLYLGRAITGGKRLNYSLVPMLGGSIGRFNGLSTGLNIELELNKFFFCSQSQYSRSTSGYGEYFVYNWSEVGYQSLKWLYAGLSVQHTHDGVTGNDLQPGFMVGFTFERFSIPIYTFDPFNAGRNFIVGLTMAWKHSKRKQPASPVVKSETPAVNNNLSN